MKHFACTLFCLIICTTSLWAQTWKEWKNPYVNEVHRLPMRTDFFPYENENIYFENAKVNNHLNLNGLWKFNWVKDADQRPTDFFKLNFDDKDWKEIPVPGMWELNGYGDPMYINYGYCWRGHEENTPPLVPIKENHVGSYRRMVEIPSDWQGKQIIIQFGSVTSNIYLWVNGKFVGYSEDSKLCCEFDVTSYLRPGQNLIAFQVFRWCDGTYLEDQDFWRLCGVARGTYLYARDLHNQIQNVEVTPDLDSTYTNGSLNVLMNIKGGDQVELKLYDKDRNVVAQQTLKSKKFIRTALEVANPKKWTAETPNLYTLTVTLKKKGETVESTPIEVGFRKVEIRDRQLLVNGQPILIKGVNRHEIDPDGGYVVNFERLWQDLHIMKEMNFNAIRTCHYPNDKQFYKLCDELGFYVVAEANVEAHGMKFGDATLAKREDYQIAHIQRNQRNVSCNYNHPCIITWSLGNESGFGPNFEICYNLVKYQDPSRPVQYEMARYDEHKEMFTDIICPMYADYDSCRRICENPRYAKPLIQCEYAHAMGNSEGGFKEYWELIRKYPKYQGGFIWDFVDQGLRAYDKQGRMYYAYAGDYNNYDWKSYQNFCNNGLVSPDRIWNPHAYEVQYFQQNIWTEPIDLKEGKINVFNEFFFKDLCPYRLDWTILKDGEPQQKGMISDLCEIGPQQRKSFTLPYDTEEFGDGEIFLNIRYVLCETDGTQTPETVVAQQQFCLQEAQAKSIFTDQIEKPTAGIQTKVLDDKITVDGADFHMVWNNEGFLVSWKKNGQQLLADGAQLKPNFWRAPTDNDFGAQLQTKMAEWKNPTLTKLLVEPTIDQELTNIFTVYNMPELEATLTIVYTINRRGDIHVSQQMDVRGENHPDMFRFGMMLQMPNDCEQIEYYGRGPIENYVDRKSCAEVGIWKQTVNEQFYPYIRPQENGTKSDVRWWKQTSDNGHGIKFSAETPFSISALHYSQESLDDGVVKHQSHSQCIDKVQYVNICIDQAQMGLGCVNTWGAMPLPEYRLPYQSRSFTFVMEAL